MSDKLVELEKELEQIKQGLFLMSVDRIRALSTHENDDLVDDLREVTESALSKVASLKG